MKIETKKINSELAIGVILIFSIIVGIAIYRAGSFSAVINYIPQKFKKNQPQSKPERVLFATNGTRDIYKVKKDDGKWAVIIDGQEGDAYDEVLNPAFSDDGTQFAYSAVDNNEAFVVLNNKASDKKYESIGQVLFNKDGNLIYKVVEADGTFLVINGQEGQKYTSIGEVVILDDGRVAFHAELNGQQVTVIDGQVVENNPPSTGTGQNASGAGANDNSSNDHSSNDNSSGGNNSNGDNTNSSNNNTTPKSGRQRKDWNIPATEKSYPVCTGSGCNF